MNEDHIAVLYIPRLKNCMQRTKQVSIEYFSPLVTKIIVIEYSDQNEENRLCNYCCREHTRNVTKIKKTDLQLASF